ncbi:MAG: methyltransferase domain-containing protein [Methylococcaceae bacterium]|nr:methyltransferase domain-containing protein [Methylococcaceae bacterium]
MLKQYLRSIPIVYKCYGFMQYLWYSAALKRTEFFEKVEMKDAEGLNYPSPTLRWRVHGAFDLDSFIQVGQRDSHDICTMLEQINYPLSGFKNILEFGCGCGRVFRHIRKQAPNANSVGTDIDNEAITWCRENIPNAAFSTNPATPPSEFTDNRFDFVYAISVFTHLDEDLQNAWLAELKRIVRPGGILLLTVHGAACYRDLPQSDKDIIATKGILFRVAQTGKLKVDGLPDFYQNTYHSEDYVKREWGKLFTVLGYFERGINDHQDAVLLRRD